MLLLKKCSAEAAGLDPLSSTPIAKSFNNLADGERETLRVKFNITHFVVRTYRSPSISRSVHWKLTMELEVGNLYTNETAGKEIIHYIAKS